MTARQTIGNFMTTNVMTLPLDMEINHAVALLLAKRISGAPVQDATGELVGILTKKDCFRAALNANYYKQWGGSVEKYMSRAPVTMDVDLDVVSAAELFLSQPYRLFPVLNGSQLVGVLSRSDLLRAFAG